MEIFNKSQRLFFAIVPVACGLLFACSRSGPSGNLPEEMQEHMSFGDFVSYESSGSVYVLAFDQDKDSKPDFWEHWNLSLEPPLRTSTADKNRDGVVDAWTYFEDANRPYMERDTDFDGRIDKWVYRDGKKAYDIDRDGQPDKVLPVDQSLEESVQSPAL